MELIEQYLQYLNEQNTAFARRIRAGKLSPQAIEKLKSMGVIKPWEHYEKGMEKGFQNVVKKTGSIVKYDQQGKGGGNYEYRTKEIHLDPKEDKKTLPVIKRHEASEAANVKRLEKKGIPQNQRRAVFIKNGEEQASHADTRVIRGEKNLVDYISPVYGVAGGTKKHREKTGEYEYLKKTSKSKQRKNQKKYRNPKSWNQVEKINKNLNKLIDLEKNLANAYLKKDIEELSPYERKIREKYSELEIRNLRGKVFNKIRELGIRKSKLIASNEIPLH